MLKLLLSNAFKPLTGMSPLTIFLDNHLHIYPFILIDFK